MGLRQIRLLGDPVLRQKAHKITKFDENLKALVQDMVETMHASRGVGLAAPQVGLSQRIIVVQTPEEEDEPDSGKLYAVVNPEIVRASENQVDGIEGCLSIPGYVGEVNRPEAVVVKGRDVSGRKIRIKAQGFLSRVFQHEIDHLEGVLFIDLLTEPDRIWRVDEGEEEQVEAQVADAEMVRVDLPLEF